MTVNLNSPEWDRQRDGWRYMHVGRRLDGELLGATLFHAPPGSQGVYHLPHGNEELLIVIEGAVELRTADGQRRLGPGEVALFRRGEQGAHAISNRSADPARYLIISSMFEPDVVEYPRDAAIGYGQIRRGGDSALGSS